MLQDDAWCCSRPAVCGSQRDLSASVQSISYRNAMFKPIMADRPGFRMEEIMCDIVHPNALGHRFARTANAPTSRHPYI